MNIRLAFNKIKNKNKLTSLQGSIFKYNYIYEHNTECLEILSDKEISEIEIESLGKIYFSNKKDKIFGKGEIDLIMDKYIILHY